MAAPQARLWVANKTKHYFGANPIVGRWPACCARAVSGHVAAPPSSVMNARRLLSNTELPTPWGAQALGALKGRSLRPA
jgi:hypothetical protein